MAKKKDKMWSGRFKSGLDPDMEKMSYSLDFDRELYKVDIQGSIAHTHALVKVGVLTAKEGKTIELSLKEILRDLDKGKSLFKPSDEDIHMAVERILTSRIGSLGKKLHTGRSRNDQVATDMRLYLRGEAQNLIQKTLLVQASLLEQSKEHLKVILPGYTHLQQGQPIYLSHYLMSFFWALDRDRQRFTDFLKRIDKMPLGSGALAGSTFAYDRKPIARELGFGGVSDNSIDATAHRDFVLEFLSNAAICGNILSRYAEDFVIWSSKEFGLIQLHDAFSTGSSMMPQKKNPDSMELIRGKSGRLLGNYTAVFTAAKGTPLCYSRDLQEDKEPTFDSAKTLDVCLSVMGKAIATMTFRSENMEKHLDPGLLATDLADILVKENIPFREAHEIVGNLVQKSESLGCSLLELPEDQWKSLPGGTKIKSQLTYASACERRNISGGTSLKSVKKQLSDGAKILKKSGKLDMA